jgi:hypothetical protein
MTTRIGILTQNLSAEQGEVLWFKVQTLLSEALAGNDYGFGTGNVRMETRTFEDNKRIDSREDARIEVGFTADEFIEETVL